MSDAQTIELVRDTLLIAMKIVVPILIAGVVVGLIIAIFQAVTSIQEQTLTFAPKIIVMLIVTVLLLPWIVVRLLEFTAAMLTNW
ncbi:MAG: flagellar biosynthesis protein FliQ [Phycisphaerales bacterium]|nr:flagellar biosynthesis protein FliQ [Phycisphaerales bacterium]